VYVCCSGSLRAAEGRLDAALQTLERATRYLAAAQHEQEEAVRARVLVCCAAMTVCCCHS
jgi:hypothetical protein